VSAGHDSQIVENREGMNDTQRIIEQAFEQRANITPRTVEDLVRDAVMDTVERLDCGELRVAQPQGGRWVVNEWVKKAVLLYFRIEDNALIQGGFTRYYDKVPSKYTNYNAHDFREGGVRVVPPATARKGAFIAPSCVLMPCYVNIGAYVDSGTMVDTWATVGSCAQIGKNVHLSGGVGIGGVLEPVQAAPVIVEDDCFIGSRSIIVEGVRIEREAVLGANVVLTSSTRILDVSGSEPIEIRGYIPSRSVVIPGSYSKSFPAGNFQVACALIIGQRKESTDRKTSLNQALREFDVPV